MNIFTKKALLMVVFMFIASVGTVFAQTSSHSVVISVDGGGGIITATSIPQGTFVEGCNHSTFCYGQHPAGAVVTVVATPDTGKILTGWEVTFNGGNTTGECAGTATTCAVTASSNKLVKAKFGAPPLTYSMDIAVEGDGVITAGNGCINSTTCYGHYPAGAVITVTATPSAGAVVTGWEVTLGLNGKNATGECTEIVTTCTVTASANKIVRAKFGLPSSTYSVVISTEGSGFITATNTTSTLTGNCTNSTFCYGQYPAGAVITVTATPSAGAVVTGWEVTFEGGSRTGECTGTATTCIVTASAHKFVKAKFGAPLIYSVAISVESVGTYDFVAATSTTGTFVEMCRYRAFCYGDFSAGELITITATPSIGTDTIVTGWVVSDGENGTGECTGTATTCTVTASANKLVKAKFGAPWTTYSIPISVDPSDPNTTSTLGTITATNTTSTFIGNCTNSTFCYGHYPAGAVITVTATPSAGAVVTGWEVKRNLGGTTGECTGTATTCIVTASAHKFVKAKFGASISNLQYRVRVSKSPTKGTLVKSSDGNISCGSVCGRKYSAGATIILTASSITPSLSFSKWSNNVGGECHKSTSSKCVLSDLKQSQNLTAEFKKVFFPVTITKNGLGKVIGKPTGINCGKKCFYNYQGGTLVTFTASPNTTSTFVGWGGACASFSSSTRCTIPVNENKEIIANFSQ